MRDLLLEHVFFFALCRHLSTSKKVVTLCFSIHLKTSLSYWNRDKRCWNVSCLQPVTSVPRHDQPSFTSHPASCNTAEVLRKNKGWCQISFSPLTLSSKQVCAELLFYLQLWNMNYLHKCLPHMHTNHRARLSERGAVEANLQKESSDWMRQPCSAAHKRNIHESNLFTVAVTFWPN